MTYQDLIEELQALSPEELKQQVAFLPCENINLKSDTLIFAEDVDFVTCHFNEQICIIV